MAKESIWLGRPIFDESHREELEKQAAINEYIHGMPRNVAEEKAYADYKRRFHAEAAAHHLHGMNLGRALGGEEGAKLSAQHAACYQLHMRGLGYNAYDPVPPEVEACLGVIRAKEANRFKYTPHPADQLIVEVSPDQPSVGFVK